jgi:2-methylcitrate dehydratase PrpD
MGTSGLAIQLADWALRYEVTSSDAELAQRCLVDTIAVALSGRDSEPVRAAATLSEPARWAVSAHAHDFDDLHLPSTTHISAVCVPMAIATGGGARAYLAAAGVMARLGMALGWRHYEAGWHATCTAGAPAVAAGAAVAMGLDRDRIAAAIALAVPGAGGVQRGFGTDAKSLQVGFAVETGLRAARLADAGATADLAAVDQWAALLGSDPAPIDPDGPAVPGGIAVKRYPCCYAMQRPISAMSALRAEHGIAAADVRRIRVSTPTAAVVPLRHHRPVTPLQAKFSLEYAVATALLDADPGLASFTAEAVGREEAVRLMSCVELDETPGGTGLLDGVFEGHVELVSGRVLSTAAKYPPGSPECPLTPLQLSQKVAACVPGVDQDSVQAWTWERAAGVLNEA